MQPVELTLGANNFRPNPIDLKLPDYRSLVVSHFKSYGVFFTKRRDSEILIVKKMLSVSLIGVSSLAQGQVIELECVTENVKGGWHKIHSITIDLDEKTFRNGYVFFDQYEVEITDEYVSANKYDKGVVTFIQEHKISRATLEYDYMAGIAGQKDYEYFQGKCDRVTRYRAP